MPARREDHAADHDQDQADQALEADESASRSRRGPAGAAAPRIVAARSCSSSQLSAVGGLPHRALVHAAGNSATLRPLAQHDDPVAEADQLGHLARGDQHPRPSRRARAAGRRSRPWRRRRRRAWARRAAAGAGRRAPPWRTRPSADCRRRARRPRFRARAGGCRRPRSPGDAAPPRARPDIRPNGEMRRSMDMTTLRPTAAQHQAAAAPVVGDEGEAGASRRADRDEPRRLAVDLDDARPSPGGPAP